MTDEIAIGEIFQLVGGYEVLDQRADDVADGDVGFLDALGIAGRNVEENVHSACE